MITQGSTVGKIKVTPKLHYLILRICEYVILMAKKDVADVIQGSNLEPEKLEMEKLQIIQWAQSNYMSPLKQIRSSFSQLGQEEETMKGEERFKSMRGT